MSNISCSVSNKSISCSVSDQNVDASLSFCSNIPQEKIYSWMAFHDISPSYSIRDNVTKGVLDTLNLINVFDWSILTQTIQFSDTTGSANHPGIVFPYKSICEKIFQNYVNEKGGALLLRNDPGYVFEIFCTISNLDINKKYRLDMSYSRNRNIDRTTRIYIDSGEYTHNHKNYISIIDNYVNIDFARNYDGNTIASFDNVSPKSDGTIILEFTLNTESRGHTPACIRICEYI